MSGFVFLQIPNVEGRAGMAAIVDPDNKLDFASLVDGMKKSLPVYARPLFLRVMKSLPMTGKHFLNGTLKIKLKP